MFTLIAHSHGEERCCALTRLACPISRTVFLDSRDIPIDDVFGQNFNSETVFLVSLILQTLLNISWKSKAIAGPRS